MCSTSKDIIKVLLMIAAIILMIFLSSCTTQRKCNRLYPPQVRVDSTHSIVVVTKYRDTTIYIQIAPDTIFKTDTVLINDNGIIYSDTIKSSLETSYASAWIYNSKIHLEHITKDTIISRIIEDAIRDSEKKETSIVTKVVTHEVLFIPWWAKAIMCLAIPSVLWLIVQGVKLFI